MALPQASVCPKCGRLDTDGATICPDDGSALGLLQAQSATNDPFVGAIINNGYVVLERLGEGGMGVVYKAVQHRLNRPVALKVLASRLSDSPTAAARLRTEARALSQLTNAHTVTVHDFGATDDGTLYLVMQLIKGETLRARLRRQSPRLDAALAIAVDVCESLAEAHELTPPIVHRDIKPDNIVVRDLENGEVFATVLDFGLARFGDAQRLTASQATIGTATYMSPEQIRSEGEIDWRADLYSLGVMLFEMIAGGPPFVSPDPMAVMYKHVHDPPPRIQDVAPHFQLPELVETLVADLLRKSPAERPASARLVRGRLLEIKRGLGEAPADQVATAEARRLKAPHVLTEAPAFPSPVLPAAVPQAVAVPSRRMSSGLIKSVMRWEVVVLGAVVLAVLVDWMVVNGFFGPHK